MSDTLLISPAAVVAGLTPAGRCRAVADAIEANPDSFDMDYWAATHDEYDYDDVVDKTTPLVLGDWKPFDCGTTCCIGGWAVAITPTSEIAAVAPDQIDAIEATGYVGSSFFEAVGGPLLGLGTTEAHDLFSPWATDRFEEITWTPEEACFLLRWHADLLDAEAAA